MFRLTQMLRRREEGARSLPPTGPVVVWNLLRRCNLSCLHCYAASADRDYAGELSTGEILRVVDELREAAVPALILSGGEPLMHPDLEMIARRAKQRGFYLALSTNGTLLDAPTAAMLAEVGFDYVGISLDGLGATHDRLRGRAGAFEESLNGVRRGLEAGLRVGLRMTLTADNFQECEGILALMDREGVSRLYLSHMNYAGRGQVNREEDATHQATRQVMVFLIETAWQDVAVGRDREIVTGNNDADGPLLLRWLQAHHPERAAAVAAALVRWGGNASGVGIANLDNRGEVHPDIFWWHHALGNVRHRSFRSIWYENEDPLLLGLRSRPRPVGGRCGRCQYLSMCGGNTRVRAFRESGDPWAEDPGCYLTDAEIFS